MKSPRLEFSFLFFAFITKQLSAATIPVLDFTGEKLLTGTEYYILSTFQDPSKICSGLNIFNEGVVYESLDLNIKFSTTESICSQPTVWRVGDFEISTGQWFITGNGVERNPGAQTLENWFKLEKNSVNTYKIRHCPSVCSSCVNLCSDVAIYSGGGVKRLALSHTPLAITFIKGKKKYKLVLLERSKLLNY
ncbi:hypothetical protein Pint_17665 [Pistacia integerrima]|uniref:Uncharacterized protein n=1 Tax=Pistacia integerrima TaxID=434235 RepID=A0ACC0Z0X0_9ROSI|nr:hypothetical protein Pint_17665 [Pistacia integerrima]